MNEQLKKDYTPVIEYIIGNFKNYIDGNFSLKRNALLQDVWFKFPLLNKESIKKIIECICLKIEIDSLASGKIIKDMNIKLKY